MIVIMFNLRFKLGGIILLILGNLIFSSQLFGKSFIWEIREREKISYLIGSVHMLDKTFYPLNRAYEESFKHSDSLVVEVDISGANAAKLSMLMMELSQYTENDGLKNNISEETYRMTEAKLKALDLDIKQFHNRKPWFVALNIAATEMLKRGFDPEFGIDRYFLKKANSKEIIELEGARFQLEMFNGFSKVEQELFLFDTVTNESTSKIEFNKMIQAWKSGNATLMQQVVSSNVKRFPKLKKMYRKLIDERNYRMFKKIDQMIQNTEKCYCIVVGAAHLVGKTGLINLLSERGYILKQL